MGYYKISIKILIPKNIVNDLIDKQEVNLRFVPEGFVLEYFEEAINALVCYENAVKHINQKIKQVTITVKDENNFNDKIANIKCLKYMQNAKSGDKFQVIPLYYLTNENREFHFEITKTTKEKYDKFIAKKRK